MATHPPGLWVYMPHKYRIESFTHPFSVTFSEKQKKAGVTVNQGIFCNFGKGPRAFQIEKISVVNPYIGKFVLISAFSVK